VKRVVIDRTLCIGAGNCVRTAGDVFDQDDEAIVVLLQEFVPADRLDAVVDAVATCPSGALSIVDD
jgi:ferredoxin